MRSLASQESVGPLLTGMKARPDVTGLACEAFNNMFSKGEEELVAQAIKHDLITYMLKLLEGMSLFQLSINS